MTRRLMMFLGLLTWLALFTGCGPSWQVIKQATPNPILGKTQFTVLPVDFTNIRIGSKAEAEWLAGKDADSQKSWADDKVAMNLKFSAALASQAAEYGAQVQAGTAAGSAPFVIKPVATMAEPGFYAGIVSAASVYEITIQITTPDGQVVDEIRVQTSEAADLYNPSSGGRLRNCSEHAGKIAGDYLKTRVKGEGG